MLIHSKAKITNSGTRTETLDGVNYLVVPAVILTEGVHHGSGGPVLYTQEELAKFPDTWNGRPLPVFHPEDENGTPVTSNSPEVIAAQSVGQTFNTVFEDGKLKTELWINVEKATRIAPEVLSIIQANGRLELSTGVFLDEEANAGTWNSEEYQGIGKNFRPDHVALLPGGTGACSWADGCGAPRTNEDEGKEGMLKKAIAHVLNMFKTNETSFEDVRRALQSEVDKLDVIPMNNMPATYHYVKAVYDNDFVYSQEGPDGNVLFRQDYTYTNGAVELSDTANEVREEKSYVTVNVTDGLKDNQDDNLNKEDDNMNKTEKVKALIGNEASPFCCEKDEAYLMGLEEATLDKHIALYASTDADAEAQAKADAELAANKAKEDAELAANKAKEDEGGDVKPLSAEEYIANAPAEVGEALSGAMALMADKKDALVSAIMSNKADVYTKDELVAMSVEALDKLATLARVTPDFSLAKGSVSANKSTSLPEPLSMPVVNYAGKE